MGNFGATGAKTLKKPLIRWFERVFARLASWRQNTKKPLIPQFEGVLLDWCHWGQWRQKRYRYINNIKCYNTRRRFLVMILVIHWRLWRLQPIDTNCV